MKTCLFKIMSFYLFLLLPGFAFAHDSTDVKPPKVTSAQPTVVYTDECLDAGNIKAAHTPIFISTWGTKESNCPAGYVARNMKVYVAVSPTFNSGEWDWQMRCCKAKVTYE